LPINLVEILRKTVTHLEEKSEIGPDDPALGEIKRNLLRVIVELELQKTTPAATAERPVIGPLAR
jgi:hypothetical protein